jgi:hypothetical protein
MEENAGKKILKIEQVDKIDPSQLVAQTTNAIGEVTDIQPSRSKFDAAVQKVDTKWDDAKAFDTRVDKAKGVDLATLDAPTRPSPLDELNLAAQKMQRLSPTTPDRVQNQAESIRTGLASPINKIDETLKTNPNVKVTPAADAELTEKLKHIDSSLKSALGIAGVEVQGAPEVTKQTQPLVKFLGYLTHGDRQINSLLTEIKAISGADASKLSPAKLLAVQIKLSFVQQELEFFTNVLNKSLESTKTLMNVQV